MALENNHEHLGFLKVEEFLGQASNCKFLKKYCAG